MADCRNCGDPGARKTFPVEKLADLGLDVVPEADKVINPLCDICVGLPLDATVRMQQMSDAVDAFEGRHRPSRKEKPMRGS